MRACFEAAVPPLEQNQVVDRPLRTPHTRDAPALLHVNGVGRVFEVCESDRNLAIADGADEPDLTQIVCESLTGQTRNR